ncbi:hypothetical protein [Rubrivirga sp. IMCC45206]|uniref:hypothetical protein n=1 Tax=Rubrivirga sp. IMCC45206 TaxID=3391614 RepID=UPI00399019B6
MRPTRIFPLLLCTLLAACGGEPDEAAVPVEDQAILAPERSTGLSVEPGAGAPPEMPPNDGPYEGEIALVSDRVEGPASVGDVRLCNMDTAPSGEWEETCYLVELQQHRDGSLYGEGTRVSVRQTDDDPGLIAPADRDSVELFGHIANDDVIHLQAAEGDRTWYARYDTPETIDFGDGVVEVVRYEGSYWASEPAASGTAVLDYETDYGE